MQVANLDDTYHFQKKLHGYGHSGVSDYRQADDLTRLLGAEPNASATINFN